MEVDALAMPWVNARVAHLLLVHRMVPMEVGEGQKEEVGTNGYDQLMYTQNVEIIEPFSSHIIPVKAGRAFMGECINIMVQALWTEDGSLPQGLTVQKMYTELRQGSKRAVLVVRNNTAYSQTLWKKTQVARAVATSPVPKPPEEEQLLEGADESHNPHTPRLTVRQRHGKLFDELDLSGLDSWAPELADAACQIPWCVLIGSSRVGLYPLHRTYDKVTDDTPFMEQFRQIPPPLVEEVRNCLWEMLESGAIRPSQSAWCNAVVLVWKKDGSLWFCIDFCHLNSHTKKDSYHLPRIRRHCKVW